MTLPKDPVEKEMPAESLTSGPVPPTRAPLPAQNGALGGWRLPSGEDLLTFALAAGLAASPLLENTKETASPAQEMPGGPPVGSAGRSK